MKHKQACVSHATACVCWVVRGRENTHGPRDGPGRRAPRSSPSRTKLTAAFDLAEARLVRGTRFTTANDPSTRVGWEVGESGKKGQRWRSRVIEFRLLGQLDFAFREDGNFSFFVFFYFFFGVFFK